MLPGFCKCSVPMLLWLLKRGVKLIKALIAHAHGDIQKHAANVEVYLNNPVGIGEHPQHLDELDKLVGKIASAEGKKKTLHIHFQNKQI